jgi:Phosphatidylinositol 3- and 4-kinase
LSHLTSFLYGFTRYFVSRNLKRAAALFEELLLKPNPPVLHWWFVQQYRNPHDWYEARTRFAESTAVWSAVGHVIGLGDRHAENILVDVSRGECVHVDFDCIFDKVSVMQGLMHPVLSRANCITPSHMPFSILSFIRDSISQKLRSSPFG